MGKSVGVSDELYEAIEAKANVMGIPKMALVDACMKYALPRVRTVVVFDDKPAPPSNEKDNGGPPPDPLEMRDMPTLTVRDQVRAVLKTANKPLNLFEIREAMTKRFGNNVPSGGLSSNIRGIRDVKANTNTVPYTYELIKS